MQFPTAALSLLYNYTIILYDHKTIIITTATFGPPSKALIVSYLKGDNFQPQNRFNDVNILYA